MLFCLYILLTLQLNPWFWSWTWFTGSLQLELFGFWTLSVVKFSSKNTSWILKLFPSSVEKQSVTYSHQLGRVEQKELSSNREMSKCLHTFSLEDGIRFNLQGVLFLYKMMAKSRNQQSYIQLCHCQKCLWLTQSSQHFNTFFHLPRFDCRHSFIICNNT